MDLHDINYANWSLYNNTNDIVNDDCPAILTTRSLTKDFDDMINNGGWESQGYETVVCK
jgi:hypothetical protein